MKKLYLLLALTPLLALFANAQQPFAIKPYAITLPRVNTSQQTNPATVPQQAGNMVYNTDQQAVAVNNGTGWGYLGAGGSGEFKNAQAFYDQGANFVQTWTIPTGVTRFLVETWGGGCGGGVLDTGGSNPIRGMFCVTPPYGVKSTGSAGGYIRRLMTTVGTNTSLSITVGPGGRPANKPFSLSAEAGGNTIVRYNGQSMTAYGGPISESEGWAADNFTQATNPGSSVVFRGGTARNLTYTYTQVDASNYLITIKAPDGGLSYGALPGQSGQGETFTLRNGTAIVADMSPAYYNNGVPGVGGGCGYDSGSWGGDGMVIIRW